MRAMKIIGWVLVGLAGAALLGFLLGIVVMLLWNWLMPALFGLPEIGYWQAVGLFILCHLLFKGHLGGGGRHRDSRWRDRWRKDGRHDFAKKVREHLGRPHAHEDDEVEAET